MNPSSLCDYCEYGYINVDNDKTCYSVIKKDEDGMKFISLNIAFGLFLSLFLFY